MKSTISSLVALEARQMSLLEVREIRQAPRATFCLCPTPASRWPIEWAYQHWNHYSEGNVIERTRSDLHQLAAEGRMYQGQMLRGATQTSDLLCSSAIVVDKPFAGSAVTELGFGIVNPRHRSNGLVQLTIAATLAERVLFDDRPTLAAVAITCGSAVHAQLALLRAAAQNISIEEADDRHATLGSFFRHCVETGKELRVTGGDLAFWLFGREAIRHQLNLIYRAGSPGGLPWGQDSKITVKVRGDLAHPAARNVLHRIVTGEAAVPFEILG